jgi:hypothetical protein
MDRTAGFAVRVACVLGLATVFGAGSAAAYGADTSPAPSPSASAASGVSVVLQTDGSHAVNAEVTVVASLTPAAAWGAVALYDGSSEIASGNDYRLTWSYATNKLGVGGHHLTVDFTPAASSGYAPSAASVDYVVTAPSPAAPAPVVSKSKDPQPIVVTIPSVSVLASNTSRPSPTASASTSVEPTSTSRASGGGKGPLPFTGFDVMGALSAAAALIGSGLSLTILGRRRSRLRAH